MARNTTANATATTTETAPTATVDRAEWLELLSALADLDARVRKATADVLPADKHRLVLEYLGHAREELVEAFFGDGR
jgi:hypothetical protein